MVLMYPDLLEDQVLANAFVPFLIEVEKSHELTLAGNQQYPGVYALLFLRKTEARAIGFRLAGYLGKLRNASDLEPIQPLLNKCINFLDNSPSDISNSRPRIQYERESVWLGLKSLIGFLEPSAFEEGILERYPIFLSVVLNHVSDDSTKSFSHAVDCLKLLFEVLGCKLWLKTTFSPSVMRNTLLGQCFHTCMEKHHKAIFDLFQPFLQSLEALQDGEFERQRRHFLYFLLHQVSHSSNFSLLMKKKACQVAISIIGRGYRLDPPCPPFECAHMWGPSVIRSVMDSSLYSSLRQPAFDLIQTIIVADAAALVSLWEKKCNQHMSFVKTSCEIDGDDDDSQPFNEVEEADVNCWTDFNMVGRLTAHGCEEWFCIPLLWVDVLTGISPSALPLSFSKSVMWALSRFSVIEPEIDSSSTMPVSQWVSMYFEKIGTSFMWDNPKGCDDGADGKGSINSVKAALQCVDLLRLMRRCGSNYASKIEGSELYKQWTWEPRMSETVCLLLVDPDDSVRQAGKVILEQVSNARGLANGLQFLCSSQSSISSMLLGLCYAIKMLMADSIISTSRVLHHLFFAVSKLLISGASDNKCAYNEEAECRSSYSLKGGFIQPLIYTASSTPVMLRASSNERNANAWKKLCELLSENIWPLLLKCLKEGKHSIQEKIYQMTFVRVLEILPLVVGYMSCSQFKKSLFLDMTGDSSSSMSRIEDDTWFHDLIDWGKSQLMVIGRHWKLAVFGILKIVKDFTRGSTLKVVNSIETMLASDNISVNHLREQLSLLLKSISVESATSQRKTEEPLKSILTPGDDVSCKDDDDVEILDFKSKVDIIVLSDDEVEKDREVLLPSKSCAESELQPTQSLEMEKVVHGYEGSYDSQSDKQNSKNNTENVSSVKNSSFSCLLDGAINSTNKSAINEPLVGSESFDNRTMSVLQHENMNMNAAVCMQQPAVEEHVLCHSPIINTQGNVSSGESQDKSKSLVVSSIGRTDSISHVVQDQNDKSENLTRNSSVRKMSTGVRSSEDLLLKKLIADDKYDPLEFALDSVKSMQPLSIKPAVSSKRQLIYLEAPLEQDKSSSERLDTRMKKYKPPRLDEWYKPILELDYFVVVGISLSDSEPENLPTAQLTEVPTSFLSADHYMNVFRPLVLEEFKAQLRQSFEDVSSPEELCCGKLRLLSLEKVDDFQLVRFMAEIGEDAASRGCYENDLVLLSRQPFQSVHQNVHMIGKVERRERDTKSRSTILVLRLYLHSGIIRLAKARRLLIERSKWCVTRLMSITPQLREFQALSAAKDLSLLSIILNPQTAAIKLAHFHNQAQATDLKMLPEPLKERLVEAFNESQLKAISLVLDQNLSQGNFRLSLIQGPPGTGKTRTILAIVSVLLAINKISNKGMARGNFSSKNATSSCQFRGKQSVSQSVAIARSWQDAALARQLTKDANNFPSKSFGMEGPRTARVLICAQSNAAVDELVSRLCKHGLYDIDGKIFKPYIVRVGNAKTVHPDSLPVFIETLVEQRLGEKKQNEADSQNDEAHKFTAVLRAKLEKLVDKIQLYEAQRSRLQDEQSNRSPIEDDGTHKDNDNVFKSEVELKAKLNILYKQKRGVCTELAAAEGKEKKAFEENKAIKQELRRAIIREAEVVVTTLSGCGGDIYSACIESASRNRNGKAAGDSLFDAVVIDEAAQALEPATLIPLQLLKLTSARCVMVGDPKQLPATVLSRLASKFSYECSMFERLQRAGYPVTMLSTQYRMHPEICCFPSAHFYDNQLKDGGIKESRSAAFHENFYLGPYLFYDVVDGYEESGRSIRSQSLCNEAEVDVVLEILRFLKSRYPLEFLPGRIGIITPYKQQVTFLRQRVMKEFGPSIAGEMEFNTVDGFQGREVDVLIFSTVRASSKDVVRQTSNPGSIGFVSDVRRMNVALTRAKLSLWIIGHARTLQRSPHWKALLKNAKERNLLLSILKPYKSIFCNAQTGSLSKKYLASDSSIKQASTEKMHDWSKISGKQLRKDMSKHDAGNMQSEQSQTNQVEESPLLSPGRNMEKHAQSNMYGNWENEKLHTEVNIASGLGKYGKMSNDSKDKANENNGQKTQNRNFTDRSDIIYRNKTTIERTGKSDRSTKLNMEKHCSLERDNKASMPDKSKPQAKRISKESATVKEKHLLVKHKHDKKNVRIGMKPNQFISAHSEFIKTNALPASRESSLQQSIGIRNPGESSGELHDQNKVNDTLHQQVCQSSKASYIESRKRQRDAVNAILPGAFFPSKRPNVTETILQPKSTTSAQDKLDMQSTSKPEAAHHQKQRVEVSSQNSSGGKDRLSEEWELFEKKLAESKNAVQSSRGLSIGTSTLPTNNRVG
ncbi:uncharacterized protein LOC131037116 isoform X2 [Cryptomeria japonica]|uniref:uncharacterized protein LOC131037116 isoform X2 n=1 Tax=Cryptomeria japonica TaxID=3369 RepID=UPI0027DA6180|nr:uncharacterized protein LOC131037116 isoform X2 [Cryptomeria japonica]